MQDSPEQGQGAQNPEQQQPAATTQPQPEKSGGFFGGIKRVITGGKGEANSSDASNLHDNRINERMGGPEAQQQFTPQVPDGESSVAPNQTNLGSETTDLASGVATPGSEGVQAAAPESSASDGLMGSAAQGMGGSEVVPTSPPGSTEGGMSPTNPSETSGTTEEAARVESPAPPPEPATEGLSTAEASATSPFSSTNGTGEAASTESIVNQFQNEMSKPKTEEPAVTTDQKPAEETASIEGGQSAPMPKPAEAAGTGLGGTDMTSEQKVVPPTPSGENPDTLGGQPESTNEPGNIGNLGETATVADPDDEPIAKEVNDMEQEEQKAAQKPEALATANPADALGLRTDLPEGDPAAKDQMTEASDGSQGIPEQTVPPLPGESSQAQGGNTANFMRQPHMSDDVATAVENRMATNGLDENQDAETAGTGSPIDTMGTQSLEQNTTVQAPTAEEEDLDAPYTSARPETVPQPTKMPTEQPTEQGSETVASPDEPTEEVAQPPKPDNVSQFPGTSGQSSAPDNVTPFPGIAGAAEQQTDQGNDAQSDDPLKQQAA